MDDISREQTGRIPLRPVEAGYRDFVTSDQGFEYKVWLAVLTFLLYMSGPEAYLVSTTLPATATPSSPVLTFPIRAAFYYPWFPQAWHQSAADPFTHYQPILGYYNQDDPVVIYEQIAAMEYGRIQVGIVSWWGQGHYTDSRIQELLNAGEATGFHWALYVEDEGRGNPTVASIQSDLEFIRTQYASSSAYLKINGRFVVFVYSGPDDNCGMVDRWTQANTVGAYLVLRVFPSYTGCAHQPDAWHQYSPVMAEYNTGQDSFTISPGFWKAGEAQPRLVRELVRWNSDIRAMIRSNANFQLVTTFNEWGEGTSVECASAWQSPSGFGLYLDALHNNGEALPPFYGSTGGSSTEAAPAPGDLYPPWTDPLLAAGKWRPGTPNPLPGQPVW